MTRSLTFHVRGSMATALLVVAGCCTFCGRCAAAQVESSTLTRQQLEAALEKSCPEMDFPGQTPLDEILEMVETTLTAEVGRPAQFMSDRVELELEGVSDLAEIQIVDVFIAAGTHSYHDALDAILQQCSEPSLTFVPQNGHLLITTMAKAESEDMLETRIFDVRKLAAAFNISAEPPSPTNQNPAAWQYGRGSRPFMIPAVDQFVAMVQQQTSPPAKWFDIDGEGGQITVSDYRAAVRQTYHVQRNIRDLIRNLQHPENAITAPPEPATARAELPTVVIWPIVLLGAAGWITAALLIVALIMGRIVQVTWLPPNAHRTSRR